MSEGRAKRVQTCGSFLKGQIETLGLARPVAVVPSKAISDARGVKFFTPKQLAEHRARLRERAGK